MGNRTKKPQIEGALFPKRKPRVFISGRCDEEYKTIRMQIVDWFTRFPLFELYDFNSEPSSTLSLQKSYLSKIDTCDVFLLVLDNHVGITEGTQLEIDRAKELGKPFMGIFINVDAGSAEIQNSSPFFSSFKYAVIQSFDEAAKKTICSLLQDLIDRYTLSLKESHEEQSRLFKSADIGVNKEIHSLAQPVADYLIHRDYPYLSKDKSKESDFSKSLVAIFKCIIGLSTFSETDFSNVASQFIGKADSSAKEIIKMRFEVLNRVFKGQLRDAQLLLQTIVRQDTSFLPEWLKNDINLDLRNLSIRLDINDGLHRYDVAGQKELSESKVVIHYPYLDRCYEKLWEELDDRFYARKGKPVNTIVIGDNLNFYYSLAEAFVTAISFGSYTHLMAFRQKYFRFHYRLCYEGNEPRRFGELNRLAILLSSGNDLEKIWNMVPRDRDILSENNIAEVATMLQTIPVREEKIRSCLLSVIYLGDYFKDEDFGRFFGMCDRECINRICEKGMNSIDTQLILKMYSRNTKRIATRITSFLDATRKREFTSYDLQSVRSLCKSSFDVPGLFPLFFEYVINRVKLDGYPRYKDFFINARLGHPDMASSIDDFVSKNANEGELADYKRFCLLSDSYESIRFFADQINAFASLLVSQVSISYPLHNPCDEAINFICIHHDALNQNECFEALAASGIHLLISDIQSAEVKFSAVKLLCLLRGYGFGEKTIAPFQSGLLSSANAICNGLLTSPMELITGANLWFALCVLHSIYNHEKDYLVREALTAHFDYPKDEIATLSILYYALSFSSETVFSEGTMVSVMDYAWRCLQSNNAAVSDYGFAVLKLFGRYPKFNSTISRGFRDLFGVVSPQQKVAIVTYFADSNADEYWASVSYQGKKDLSWRVRTALISPS